MSPKVVNRKVIYLPSLFNEDDTPFPVVIGKISAHGIGMEATMRLVQKRALVREAAYRAEQGSGDSASVAETPPFPGSPPVHEYEDSKDPDLQLDLYRASEIMVLRDGLIEPTYEELCVLFSADPESPYKAWGPDFDEAVAQISQFSGFKTEPMAGKVMTPPEAERFPASVRGNAGRDGGEVR